MIDYQESESCVPNLEEIMREGYRLQENIKTGKKQVAEMEERLEILRGILVKSGIFEAGVYALVNKTTFRNSVSVALFREKFPEQYETFVREQYESLKQTVGMTMTLKAAEELVGKRDLKPCLVPITSTKYLFEQRGLE